MAHEAVGRRSGDSQRTRVVVRAGSAERHRDAGSYKPDEACLRRRANLRSCLRAQSRFDARGDAVAVDLDLAGRAGRTAWLPVHAARSCARCPASRHARSETSLQALSNSAEHDGPMPERTRVLQRTGRVFRRRPGVCDDSRARSVDSGSVDQRHRQSELWISGRNGRWRQHMVCQQQGEPAHALVERSCVRPVGRSVLSPRYGFRRSLERNGAADPRRGCDVCRLSWPWLQPVYPHSA